MSIAYQNICKAVALRANQIIGGDASERNTAYQNGNIATQLDGVDVPFAALKQDVLAVEKEIAEMIGKDTSSIYRAYLQGTTAFLGSGGAVPVNNGTANNNFVGVWDGVYDGTDNLPLTEMPIQVIKRRNRNSNGFFKSAVYFYKIDGSRIYHTRTTVYLRGCLYNAATQSTAFDAFGNSVLPDALENLWIAKVLSGLAQENWFVENASYYRSLVADKEAGIIEGRIRLTELPQVISKQNTANPVTN